MDGVGRLYQSFKYYTSGCYKQFQTPYPSPYGEQFDFYNSGTVITHDWFISKIPIINSLAICWESIGTFMRTPWSSGPLPDPFEEYATLYDTLANNDFNQKRVIPWTGIINFGSVSLSAADYVQIRSGVGHYPATDATYSGIFITPHFVSNMNSVYFYFGNYKSKWKFTIKF